MATPEGWADDEDDPEAEDDDDSAFSPCSPQDIWVSKKEDLPE